MDSIKRMFDYKTVLKITGGMAILFGLSYYCNGLDALINVCMVGWLGAATWVIASTGYGYKRLAFSIAFLAVGAGSCIAGEYGYAFMAGLIAAVYAAINPFEETSVPSE